MRKILTALSFFLITACSTPYQNSGFLGGYDEIQLADNIFQVTFKGNGYTSAQRAIDFTLLRSAEIAMENGYKYFVINDAQSRTKTSLQTIPGSMYVEPSISTVSKPSTSNTITLINEPTEWMTAFEAEITAQSIRNKYGLSR